MKVVEYSRFKILVLPSRAIVQCLMVIFSLDYNCPPGKANYVTDKVIRNELIYDYHRDQIVTCLTVDFR